ncbi:MAG: hypothetical protein K9N47_21075 [Prosthecobacter sp.]|uniref:hypothetical protein n=1 Tax=Prosthecobacter sp. TaxID=1965333 RepID=UPI00261647A0|nr:hypothetical protein [Prosthecobacter sp.]MCF7788629.1 hypothetical protein [Prosthecobacter sp.]
MIPLAALPTPEAMDFWKFLVSAWALYSIYAKWVETQAHKKMMRSGTKEEPFSIAQPLSVKKHVTHADQSDMDKLSTAVTSLTQTVNTNNTTLLLSGAEREASIKEALRKEVGVVMREVTTVKDSMNEALTDMRERIASAETRLDILSQ